MRILQIVPGSGGGFYCQNCLRDLNLGGALRRLGHDAMIMPLYLPLSQEGLNPPLFFGAIRLYLGHRFPGAQRRWPNLFRRLDHPALLRWAGRFAGATSAGGLTDLTLSMLRGEEGRQAVELDRLAQWLAEDPSHRPDAILLSNGLLLGLGRRLREATGAPVFCWLQDETVWTDAMPAQDDAAVWQAMADRAPAIDGWLSVSASYAQTVMPRLGLPPSAAAVVPIGVDPAAYPAADVHRVPPVIGYLGRLNDEEGFGCLVEAFVRLHRDRRWSNVRMAATGGMPADRRAWRRCRRLLADRALTRLCSIDPLRFQHDRPAFLASLTLFSAPAGKGDAGAMNVIEALAAGVPVVQPEVGAYPEILDRAGCGTRCRPGDPGALAEAWAGLLADPDRMRAEAAAGRAAAGTTFTLEAMAAAVVRAIETTGRS